MVEHNIFAEPLAQTIFLFIFVFTLVFAILQKSQILGKEKKQVDALIGFAIAMIVTSVGYASDIISRLIPFLAVSLVIIFVFMILLGFFFKEDSFDISAKMKVVFGIFIFIAVASAVLTIVGGWDYITGLFRGEFLLIENIIFFLVIGGAIAIVFAFDKKKS
ncbi:MAG: hypothetical protein AABW65_00725 [Nanoarchaeota archaeon]